MAEAMPEPTVIRAEALATSAGVATSETADLMAGVASWPRMAERKTTEKSGPSPEPMKIGTMKQIAAWILRVLKSPADEKLVAATKAEVADLAEQFPVPAAKLDVAER